MRAESEIAKKHHRLIDDATEYGAKAEFEKVGYNQLMLTNQAYMSRMLAALLEWVLSDGKEELDSKGDGEK